jgi:hypothetical protein
LSINTVPEPVFAATSAGILTESMSVNVNVVEPTELNVRLPTCTACNPNTVCEDGAPKPLLNCSGLPVVLIAHPAVDPTGVTNEAEPDGVSLNEAPLDVNESGVSSTKYNCTDWPTFAVIFVEKPPLGPAALKENPASAEPPIKTAAIKPT